MFHLFKEPVCTESLVYIEQPICEKYLLKPSLIMLSIGGLRTESPESLHAHTIRSPGILIVVETWAHSDCPHGAPPVWGT